MKNKYICGAIWMIVSSSGIDNGYILDWVASVMIKGIYLQIYWCTREG